jgi:hypothetical protein
VLTSSTGGTVDGDTVTAAAGVLQWSAIVLAKLGAMQTLTATLVVPVSGVNPVTSGPFTITGRQTPFSLSCIVSVCCFDCYFMSTVMFS